MTNLNPWQSAGLAGAMRVGANQGIVVYVDGTGPDTNDGLSVETPLATITAALTLCTNGHQDYIIILDYWQPAGETWPVNVNVENVSIVGAGYAGHPWPHLSPPDDTAALNITAQQVDVSYLMPDGGDTSAGIEISGLPMGVSIHHCQFGTQYAAQDGIRITGDCPAGWYYNNQFGRLLTRSGIRFTGGGTFCRVEDNQFYGPQGVQVYGNAIQYSVICNNFFAMHADVAGDAITLTADAVGVFIDGNSACWGETAVAHNNPYLDQAAVNVNHWGHNYWNEVVTVPG